MLRTIRFTLSYHFVLDLSSIVMDTIAAPSYQSLAISKELFNHLIHLRQIYIIYDNTFNLEMQIISIGTAFIHQDDL